MSTPEQPAELGLPEKLLAVDDVLTQENIPHAFGGALALGFHAEPRATTDIDINIALPAEEAHRVLGALTARYPIPEIDRHVAAIANQHQTRTAWGAVKVDLFFPATPYHGVLAERVVWVPFGGRQIPIITAEDLVVCKAMFDRPKDWVDIANIYQVQAGQLDSGYVRHWLSTLMGADDHRLARLERLSADR